MKKIKTLFNSLLCGILFLIAANTQAQDTSPKQIDSIKAAIQKDPSNLDLHEAYLKASGFTKWGAKEDPAFINQYKKWMKEFPKVAAIPYALGHAYADKESPKAKPYLLKAIDLDPKMDVAYFDLWIDADRWGQFEKGREYIGKASELQPNNPDYAFYYAAEFDNVDPKKYEEMSLEVANKFPESERGAQALYWLAVRNINPQLKAKYFEMLKDKFPPSKFDWSSSGMSGYYDLLLKESPEKAQSLAESMLAGTKDARDKKMWQQNLNTAKSLNQVNTLMSQKNYSEAVNILDSVKVSRWSSAKDLILLQKARALSASGNVKKAYNDLKYSYALSPEPVVEKALNEYGLKLGKNNQEVMKDVWYIRDTMSKPATPFTLTNYFTKGKTSLSDYKGKVVLLTYWFPGCGPCRGEFPHFQNVVNKFKGKDFAYVGINIVSEQNDYVLPFMKSSGYTFTPLEDIEGRDKGNLNNGGAAPVNFLIDKDGKIVFKNIRTDGSNEDVLEAMISQTLTRD